MKKYTDVILGAFGFVYHYRIVLFKTLCLPMLALVFIAITYASFSISGSWLFLLTAVYYLIHTIIAVTTHRIILLGEDSVPEWWFRTISIRDLYFILYSIGLGIIMIPAMLLVVVPVVGWVLAILACVFLLARFSLVLPAIATDQRWRFYDSWEKTQNHQLMMIVTVVVFPIVIALPETLLAYVPYAEVPTAILSSLTTVFVVAALSVAFKIVDDENEGS